MTLLNEYKDTGRLNVQTACIFIAYAEKCTAHLRRHAHSGAFAYSPKSAISATAFICCAN